MAENFVYPEKPAPRAEGYLDSSGVRWNAYDASQLEAYARSAVAINAMDIVEAGKALSFAAQISGGTAGPDPGLQAAVERFSVALARGQP